MIPPWGGDRGQTHGGGCCSISHFLLLVNPAAGPLGNALGIQQGIGHSRRCPGMGGDGHVRDRR